MEESEEGEDDWRAEADAIIRDIQRHVHVITISNLPNSTSKIFFNMTTLEKKDFCMELTQQGFRIVGEKYDSEDQKGKYSIYETPYSMLDSLSPAYRDSFGEELFRKLVQLQKDREENENKEVSGDDGGEPYRKVEES